jgi:hypothetical protein
LIHDPALEISRGPGIADQGFLKERVLWECVDIFDVIVPEMDDDVADVVEDLDTMEYSWGRALVY